jgi:hypothetical protein
MLTQWLPLSCSSPSMNDTLADFTLNINHGATQGQGFILLSRSLGSAVKRNVSVPDPTVRLLSLYQNLTDGNVLKQSFAGFQNPLVISLVVRERFWIVCLYLFFLYFTKLHICR